MSQLPTRVGSFHNGPMPDGAGPFIDVSEAVTAARFVAGVAASARDTESLLLFVSGLSDDDAAVVICLARQDPADDAPLLESIVASAGRPAELATDGLRLAARTVYLVPADHVATLEAGTLRLRAANDAEGRGRIDSLLVSIARSMRERAIVVVLAACGADGTLGIAQAKQHGGLTIAQQDRRYEAAPGREPSLPTADHTLPAAQLAEPIGIYQRHLDQAPEQARDRAARDREPRLLADTAAILLERTSYDFHAADQDDFARRVLRRSRASGCADLAQYITMLREEPSEPQLLFNDMFTGHRRFMREPAEFERLQREVLPRLFQGRTSTDQIRVWVLGCATGEEVYSLAILLREHMATCAAPPHVQIFATDMDSSAMAAARVGRYAAEIAPDVGPDRLRDWFVQEADTYRVAKPLRDMCIFSQHGFTATPPFLRIDLICCRNLLTYISLPLQDDLGRLFNFALRPHGFLMIGSGESFAQHRELFAPIDDGVPIYSKLDLGWKPHLHLAVPVRPESNAAGRAAKLRSADSTLAQRARQIAQRHAPSYVVVDRRYDAVHFSTGIGRFFDPGPGHATLSIMDLVHRDLRLDLLAALHEASASKLGVNVGPVRMGSGTEAVAISMSVTWIEDLQDQPPHLMVLFQDARVETDPGKAPISLRPQSGTPYWLEEPQRDVASGPNVLLEARATTATDEDPGQFPTVAWPDLSRQQLAQVNEGLCRRVEQLSRANSDLQNLLENTQVATIFLDGELRISNFTPAVQEIFPLIQRDLGRPITDISGGVNCADIEDDLRRVLRTLVPIDRELGNTDTDARFLMRVRPFRSVDNFIAGVVLTFRDLTEEGRAERALRASEERFRMMARAVHIVLFIATPDLRFEYINSRFYQITGMADGSALGHGWMAAIHPDDVEPVRLAWASSTDSQIKLEIRLRDAHEGFRWIMLQAKAIRDTRGEILRWFGFGTEIHEARLAAERQRMLLAELQHRVKNILAVVRSIFSRTMEAGGLSEEVADHFRGRLDALARTQTVLARTAEGSVDLEDLVREELLSLGATDGEHLKIVGPAIRLPANAAEAIGLAVHELATNAVKYGALSIEKGMINVQWHVDAHSEGRRLAFEWREHGVPMVGKRPARRGFGRELIEQGLPYQLGATTAIDFLPGGVRCAINLKLPDTDGRIPGVRTTGGLA